MPGTLPIRQYDLVICDVDGCLSPEASAPFDLPGLTLVAEHNTRAIARGDRPVLTVCTGRPQPFAEAMCRLVQNSIMPCVCENGAWVYHPGTNAYQLDPAITPGHLEAVGELSRWCRTRFGGVGVTQQPGKTASVTLYHPDTAFLRSIMPQVAAECETRRWPFRVSMTWLYINCDLSHINKGTGLDRMLAQHNIEKSRMVGIGDTAVDKCIAERVGFFACPANAQPAIKEHAHFIASQPEVHGVLEILKRISE
jgi:hydroxymethylpyrimidine pyrophosphatase-like HAD family hydrolase